MVYRLWAEWREPGRIVEYCQQEWGKEVSEELIRKVCRTRVGKLMVERFRMEFLQSVRDVPIANKRVRLDALEATRVKLQEMIEMLTTVNEGDRHDLLMCMRRMNETICVAREEMEARPTIVNQIGQVNQYSGLSDDEIMQRREKIIEKIRSGTGLLTVEEVG